MGLSSAILRHYSPLKNWSAEILANHKLMDGPSAPMQI